MGSGGRLLTGLRWDALGRKGEWGKKEGRKGRRGKFGKGTELAAEGFAMKLYTVTEGEKEKGKTEGGGN